MVGNRPDGSVGEMPVPGIAGSFVPGGNAAVDELGIAVLAATTTYDPVPVKDRAPDAVASAEMRTDLPTVAVDRTGTAACSSAA